MRGFGLEQRLDAVQPLRTHAHILPPGRGPAARGPNICAGLNETPVLARRTPARQRKRLSVCSAARSASPRRLRARRPPPVRLARFRTVVPSSTPFVQAIPRGNFFRSLVRPPCRAKTHSHTPGCTAPPARFRDKDGNTPARPPRACRNRRRFLLRSFRSSSRSQCPLPGLRRLRIAWEVTRIFWSPPQVRPLAKLRSRTTLLPFAQRRNGTPSSFIL